MDFGKRLESLTAQQRQQLLAQMRSMVGKNESHPEPIAVVGIGCRFPGGSDTPDAYWQLLRRGGDGMAEVPRDRWDIDAYFDPNPDAPGKVYTRWFGLLKDRIDAFDAEFFDIPGREARGMDPQQRLLMEVAWEALENAAIAPERLFGSDTGVFMGLSTIEFHPQQFAPGRETELDVYSNTGVNFSVASGRLSYFLGMHGPAVAVDTACSSSLTAVHLACNSLRSRECQVALAGGVSLLNFPGYTIGFCRGHMLAPDGPSKSFDAAANGYMRGEGAGVVVLKRLSDALFDRDHIYALVRGTAVNQDGRSSGLTAPNGPAQQAVIRKALANAGLKAEEINYLEAHGTGTPLGDPIEVQALAAVLAAKRSPDNPLFLGSVKANIGHLEAAAGITGFIKLALSLHHDALPPQIHFKKLNPNIQIDGIPIKISTELGPWPKAERRLGGVSSFGFSGTNAHVILEGAPKREHSDEDVPERSAHVLTLSARTEPAVLALAKKFSAHIKNAPETSLADMCYSANVGRSVFDHRIAVVGASHEQMHERLEAVASGNSEGVRVAAVNGTSAPRVAFMFTGQGCQYRGMGRVLYETQDVFRDAMDRCAAIIDDMLTVPLLKTLYDANSGLSIDNTLYAQPAIFAIEYSLAELWKSWGIQPAVVMGHSLGEYAAATLSGAVSLEGALTLVAARARLSATLKPEGEMAATMAGPEKLAEVLGSLMDDEAISIAAYNGPESTVISGKYAPMKEALERLAKAAIRTQVLAISNSFHSPSVEPILKDFVAAAATITFSPTRLPLVSNLTGAIADETVIGNPEYWGRHLREPVRFKQSLQVLREEGVTHFIEAGPKPTLLNMGRKCLPEHGELAWLSSLKPERNDWDQMFESLGALFVAGHPMDWQAIEGKHTRYRVPMPTYAFQRQRHALEPMKVVPRVAASAVAEQAALDTVVETSKAAARGILGGRIDTFEGHRLVESLCAGYVAHALKALEAFAGNHKALTAEELLTRGRVAQPHCALVQRWLPRLVEHGHLTEQEGRYSDLKAPTKTALRTSLEDARDSWKRAPSMIGWATTPLDYIQRCGERLAAVLRGGDPLEALFAQDYFGTAASFYEDSADAHQHNQLASETLKAYVRSCPADKHFHVLEIGAGSGGFTSAVVPALPVGRTSYAFTDTSGAFFTRANARFGRQTLLACSTLDISRDPAAQGFPAGGFDIVVASNVLHATPNLHDTLQRVEALLKPGGIVLFNEVTARTLWYDLLFGPLLPTIAGDPLRKSEHLMTPKEWRQALESAGLGRLAILPQEVVDSDDANARTVWWSIIFGQKRESAVAAAAEAMASAAAAAPGTTAVSERAVEIKRIVEALKAAPGPDPARTQLLSQYLQHLVADVVGISSDRVGPQMELVGLGMDSLMAMELAQRVEQDLGRRLPIAALTQASSLPKLSELLSRPVGASALDACMVELSQGEGAPLALVHPSGGGILCYTDLAQGLGGYPVVGFQAQGLLEKQEPHSSIEDMAKHYLALLRQKQPEGPYVLGGWSLGGVVAFEMALQLQAENQTVASLTLIDSWLPTKMSWPSGPGLAHWFVRDMAGLQGSAAAPPELANIPADVDGQLSFMVEYLKSKKVIPSVLRPNHIKPQYQVFRAGIDALSTYKPRVFQGSINLLRATQRAAEVPEVALTGWQSYASRGLRTVDVRGSHFTIMQKPTITAIAHHVSNFLANKEKP